MLKNVSSLTRKALGLLKKLDLTKRINEGNYETI